MNRFLLSLIILAFTTTIILAGCASRTQQQHAADAIAAQEAIVQIQQPIATNPSGDPIAVKAAQDTVAIATGQGHTDYGRYGSQHGSNPIQLVGAQLAWSTVRVNVTGTGKKVKLSIFEWKLGVEEGFPNQAFPGE